MHRLIYRVMACAICLLAAPSLAGSPQLSHARQPDISAEQRDYTPPSLWLEELTWPEIAMSLQAGYRAVLVPTGGIEQNGPHMPLYKHRRILGVTAPQIAQTLGKTLIAPIIDFVPAGDVKNKTGNMAFSGTISIPPRIFAGILEHTTRSLLAHGFTHIFYIGNNEQNLPWQEKTASEFQAQGHQVFHLNRYYANDLQEEFLQIQGFSESAIGGHAGLRDTSEFMAASSNEVRRNRLENIDESRFKQMGAYGYAARAAPGIGGMLLRLKVEQAVMQACEYAWDLPGCPE